jgi:hypothetical protein
MVPASFRIVPGTPYRSRYRLVLRDGPADTAAFDRYWRDYAEPPRVTVTREP